MDGDNQGPGRQREDPSSSALAHHPLGNPHGPDGVGEKITRGRQDRNSSVIEHLPEGLDPLSASLNRPPSTVTIHTTKNGQPPQKPVIDRHVSTQSSKPYSAFSQSTKYLIVGISGIAGVFSPISSNIFVPAIPTLSEAFNRSEQDISLAVTIYLVFQAITPSFFGAMSDSYGRRPVYIGTLIIYLGANVGLALMPTSAYWLLLFLRALQVIHKFSYM